MRTVVFVVLVGCASAEPTAQPIDASPTADAAIRDAAPKPVDAPPDAANLCPTTVTCQTATMLGTVSGDQPSPKLMMTGYQHAWFRVRVTEDFSEPFPGLALRLQAKVTAPAGVQFDTFVYVGANDTAIECAATTGTKTNTGNVTQVRAEWGEGDFGNNVGDDRNVTIEVRPLGTNCAPSAMWQLEVEGNWI